MKTSWNWLAEWVDLDGLDPNDVAHRLTMAGLEVEGVEFIGHGHDKIVVGKINAIDAHPDADKLVVCQVSTGDGEDHQIVCGAKNMKAGDRVPVALPGSQPPAFDFEIGKRKMRGVESHGMLCAGEELGMDDGVDGLLILDEAAEIGRPIFEALGAQDVVFEIGLTPNRPDCLSHRGVAREIATLYGRELKEHTGAPLWESVEGAEASTHCGIEIVDYEGCPRYAFAVIEGVKVGPSPFWLAQRLRSIGLRPVNNLVDVTNYINFDIGQPLHAFDLDKLQGPEIIVRRADAGEEIVGIDHATYKLDAADLVIADAGRPVAIAGVMGGEATEVTESTTRILIECAYFDPTSVRKSAKRHALHTDSSHRFERGIDPGATVANLARAVDYMSRVAGEGARIAAGHVLAQREDAAPTIIEFPVALSSKVLGVEVSAERSVTLLEGIGVECKGSTADVIWATVPTWRPDLERPIDLVEEIARLIGFDEIPTEFPSRLMGEAHVVSKKEGAHAPTIVSAHTRGQLGAIRRLMLDYGFHEAVNSSFMGPEELDALDVPEEHALRQVRELANPLKVDMPFMRTTLLTGLLRNLVTNVKQKQEEIAIFEIGRRYLSDGEPLTLSFIATGNAARHWSGRREWDFYDFKGLVDAVVGQFELGGATWVKPDESVAFLHPGVQAQLVLGGDVLATIGRLHPKLEQERKLPTSLLAEVDIARVLELASRKPLYKALSIYPTVKRDFALVQDRGQAFAAIEAQISELAEQEPWFGEILESVEVFDVYEGERIEDGKRSVALQIVLRSHDGTLGDETITKVTDALVSRLEENAGATLR